MISMSSSISSCLCLPLHNSSHLPLQQHHPHHRTIPLFLILLKPQSKPRHHHHHHFSASPIHISILNPSRPRYPCPCPIRVSAVGSSDDGGVDVAALRRPGSVVETDKLPADVRNRTMEAVNSFGGRVTVGDVAGRAGLKVDVAQRALQALAADTDGFLEVSDEGDVLFVFPKDYRGKLASKSLRLKVEPWVEKAKSTAEYLVRVSFGTALIASIVIVFTAIIAILTSSKSDDDNRGRRGRRAYDSGFSFYLNPADLFWYWDPYNTRRSQTRDDDDDQRMNFVESVFSFVFGDGDPNQGIEEKRWKLIGQYIAEKGGVVTAEELAPYLDVENAAEPMGDESFVLPVLLRFNGDPEVDEEGNILYRFPSLQRTASSERQGKKEYVGNRWPDWVGGAENFFKENKWRFSKTRNDEKAMVIGLGAVNLFGVVLLGALLRDMGAVRPSGFLTFVTNAFPLLQVYAGSFFAIPLFRWFFISKTNYGIDKRNTAREQCAQVLQRPDASLRRKLLSARDMSQKTVIGQDRIIYSSDKDLLEQDYDAREWERKFREVEKSD